MGSRTNGSTVKRNLPKCQGRQDGPIVPRSGMSIPNGPHASILTRFQNTATSWAHPSIVGTRSLLNFIDTRSPETDNMHRRNDSAGVLLRDSIVLFLSFVVFTRRHVEESMRTPSTDHLQRLVLMEHHLKMHAVHCSTLVVSEVAKLLVSEVVDAP